MSVQNLREKFNRTDNGGVLSSPGTSYGAAAATKSKFEIVDNTSASHPFKNSPINATINASHRVFNKTPAPFVLNGASEPVASRVLKTPEQTQQDLIARKWNQNGDNASFSSSSSSTLPLIKSKACLSRFINQRASIENPPIKDERDNDIASSSDYLSNAREKLKTVHHRSDSSTGSSVDGDHRHDSEDVDKCDPDNILRRTSSSPSRSSFLVNGGVATVDGPLQRNNNNAKFTNGDNEKRPHSYGTNAIIRSSQTTTANVKMGENFDKVPNGDHVDKEAAVGFKTVKSSPSANGAKMTETQQKWTPTRLETLVPKWRQPQVESQVPKWRQLQPKAEFKRIQLSKSSLLPQDDNNLESKYQQLQKDYENVQEQFQETSDQLYQLRKISEAMYKEYDQLRHQYKLETSTLQQAIERASMWYKQNRELKRRSSALMQHVISVRPDYLSEMKDEVDAFKENDTEIEELQKTIKDLTTQVSKLQAELNSLKIREYEAQEQIVELRHQLVDNERRNRSTNDVKLKRNNSSNSILNDDLSSMETKLHTTETELLEAVRRAEKAESEAALLSNQVSELENELSRSKNNNTTNTSLVPPPPPPPPPLPPLPPLMTNSNTLQIRKSVPKGDQQSEDSAVDQMAGLLGIPKKASTLKVQNGVIDDIINEIKGGRFTLKAPEKQNSIKKEEPPPVVHEMFNILGTLRRPSKRKENGLETTTP